MAAITTTLQTVLVDDVGDVIVTEIVDDGQGAFVREIRIVDASLPNPIPVFTLRLRAPTALRLDLTTPPLSY